MRLLAQIRVVEPRLLARIAERAAVDEGGTARAAQRIRPHIFGFDERHERGADLEMADEVDRIPIERGLKTKLVALEEVDRHCRR